MRVLVMCPGSFAHGGKITGLNSPERGEGRWAMNYAHMLALAGHEVYAASGGVGRAQRQMGVTLIDQGSVTNYGNFDLFIDAAWWDNKEITVTAKKYVALKWSPEDYLYKPFPDNFYLAYPYVSHNYNFSRNNFPNRDKTFALPTMFGLEPAAPNWGPLRSVFLPGKIDINRPYKQYINAIDFFLQKHPVEGTSKTFFEGEFGQRIFTTGSNWVEKMPYDEVLAALDRCRISLPILNPGCIIEAAFRGVPSVFWEHGGFFNPLAQSLNMLIEHDAPPERFTEVVETLMTNKKKHAEVTYASQEYFSAHTFEGSLRYFDLFCETVGLT